MNAEGNLARALGPAVTTPEAMPARRRTIRWHGSLFSVVDLAATPYTVRFPNESAVRKECKSMTIDKSLRIRAGTTRARNVLTRAERLAKLQESERWSDGDSVLGLPKVLVQKLSLKKKKKAKKADEEEAKE